MPMLMKRSLQNPYQLDKNNNEEPSPNGMDHVPSNGLGEMLKKKARGELKTSVYPMSEPRRKQLRDMNY